MTNLRIKNKFYFINNSLHNFFLPIFLSSSLSLPPPSTLLCCKGDANIIRDKFWSENQPPYSLIGKTEPL